MRHCDRKIDFLRSANQHFEVAKLEEWLHRTPRKFMRVKIYIRYCVKKFEENHISSLVAKIQEKSEKEL